MNEELLQQAETLAAIKPELTELDEPIWSVISADECLMSGLTYDRALRFMDVLKKEKIGGLCIVTDEAAHRAVSRC